MLKLISLNSFIYYIKNLAWIALFTILKFFLKSAFKNII